MARARQLFQKLAAIAVVLATGAVSGALCYSQSCPTCIGSAQCYTGAVECVNGVWVCSDGTQPCVGPEPAPCCQECYESCTTAGWTCYGSPILIDAQGQGFHLTSLNKGVQFEMSPGTPMQVSWTNPAFQNAFLALDRNGNGKIDDGSELFGEFTPQPPTANPNGYAALAVFDDPRNGGNGNGRIDPGDAIYSSLRLWVDRNHNGISEPEELIPLAEAGVFSIDLHYVEDRYFDAYGNWFHYRAMVWDEAGHAANKCYDVFLQLRPTSEAK